MTDRVGGGGASSNRLVQEPGLASVEIGRMGEPDFDQGQLAAVIDGTTRTVREPSAREPIAKTS